MPDNMKQDAGWLLRNGERLACPTEEQYFEMLGLPFIPLNVRDDGKWNAWLEEQQHEIHV